MNCGISPVGLFGSPLWQASLVKATVTPQLPSKNPICWLPASWETAARREGSRAEVMATLLKKHGLALGPWDGTNLPEERFNQSARARAGVYTAGVRSQAAACQLPDLEQATSLASVSSPAPCPWLAVRDAHGEHRACCAQGVSFCSPLVVQDRDLRTQSGSKNTSLHSGH